MASYRGSAPFDGPRRAPGPLVSRGRQSDPFSATRPRGPRRWGAGSSGPGWVGWISSNRRSKSVRRPAAAEFAAAVESRSIASGVDDRQGAREATREAVGQNRKLASLRLDTFLPDLARSFNTSA